jgi:hypothetical protein
MPHLWIGIALALASVVQLVFPIVAEPVVGHIVDKHTSTSRKHGTSYEVTIAYHLNGRDETTSQFVDEDFYAVIDGGEEVALRAARILGFNEVQAWNENFFPFWVLFALPWNAFVALFIVAWSWPLLSRWWVLKWGTRVEGVLDEVKRTVGRKGGVAVEARYHFSHFSLVRSAQVMSGLMRVSAEDFEHASPLPPNLTIFYHPRWPSISVVYELSAWEIEK